MKPNDHIVGRPIRLNRQVLTPRNGFAQVHFLGDAHYGSPQFDRQRFLDTIQWCLANKSYVLLMGDLIELATRHSVGAGVYEQEIHCQSQHEQMVRWLQPLAEKGLILGSLTGNHERAGIQGIGCQHLKSLMPRARHPLPRRRMLERVSGGYGNIHRLFASRAHGFTF